MLEITKDIDELKIGDLLITKSNIALVTRTDGIFVTIKWSFGKIEEDYIWTILEDARHAGWKLIRRKNANVET